ncbi:MAG: hypothetical protein M3022_09410 [Actinomycetota bacterium]|nr:hypothetical protein [Actinomycetota bacterium]
MSADAISVENRLDKVVLVARERRSGLTAARARELALALQQAADRAEQTPGS